ncbi:DUF6478 family protein [Poseidonocella sedimentorum]|uniref:Uncharacterized protein n=1 Tax=Poseidonocella sedimentorum TaxID=871652 RepID=A0A1I6D6B8_9RHOB|nr:DUF6478 family protein [Poseidonocella sedimentorum]SFR00867.1 hypothetical protein SAMN04515673_102238 [Poseidonocella sedimentorum]
MIDRFIQNVALRAWRGWADAAARRDPRWLRQSRGSARRLKGQLERFLSAADRRLAMPATTHSPILAPSSADWTWRPGLWRAPLPAETRAAMTRDRTINDEVSLFAENQGDEIILRQPRNWATTDLCPYGLEIETFHVAGAFLSLVITLPEAAAQGLTARHLIGLSMVLEVERPQGFVARINIRHGPNTAQIPREIPPGDLAPLIEFDLAYAELDDTAIGHVWLDLIFDQPAMNRIRIRDLTLMRLPRSEL